MPPRRRSVSSELIGRQRDLEVVGSFVDRAALSGGALVVSGEAGVGKTALLGAAAENAASRGFRVLRAAGAEFEADVSFAALNQLLYPLFDMIDVLRPSHAQALRVSLGLDDGSRSDQLVASTAALELLVHAAQDQPLVVVVDDVPWLDRASSAILAFVARRLADPARRAWHLAEASVGPDEDVAALLQMVAHANLRRGDSVGAITELLRAADLSPAGPDKSIRLAEAAYLGASVTGDLLSVPELLDAARRADPDRGGSLAGAVAGGYHLLNGHGDVDAAHRLLHGAIEELPTDAFDVHNQQLVEALYNLLMVCFFAGRPEPWVAFQTDMGRLRPRPPALLDLLAETFADPARTAQRALPRLDDAIARLPDETSPARIVRVAIAAAYLDRLPACRGALWRAVEHGRDGGAVTSAIEALFLLGNGAFWTGEWDELDAVTSEGLALCDTHGYRLLAWPGRFLQSLLAAARGDDVTTTAVTNEMIGWASPRGVRAVFAYAWHARALAALGRADYDDAYHYAGLVSPRERWRRTCRTPCGR